MSLGRRTSGGQGVQIRAFGKQLLPTARAGPEAWFYRMWTRGARVRAAGGKRSIENASKGVQKSLDRCLDDASQQSRNVALHLPRVSLSPSRSHKAVLTTGRFAEEVPAAPSEVSDPGRELGVFLVSRTGAPLGRRKGNLGCCRLRPAGGGPLFPLLPSGTSSRDLESCCGHSCPSAFPAGLVSGSWTDLHVLLSEERGS